MKWKKNSVSNFKKIREEKKNQDFQSGPEKKTQYRKSVGKKFRMFKKNIDC